jgi:hypothetical protein
MKNAMPREAKESKSWSYLVQAVAAFPLAWAALVFMLWLRAFVKLGHAPKPMFDDPKGFDMPIHCKLIEIPLEGWLRSFDKLRNFGISLRWVTKSFNALGLENIVIFFPIVVASLTAAILIWRELEDSKRKFPLILEICGLIAMPVLIALDPGQVLAWILD